MQGWQGPSPNTNVRYLIVVYDEDNNILEMKRFRVEMDIVPYINNLPLKYKNKNLYIEQKTIIKINYYANNI